MNEYITANDAAKNLGRHSTLIRKWCRQGRIPGAIKVGRDWIIPANTTRPAPGKPGNPYKKNERE